MNNSPSSPIEFTGFVDTSLSDSEADEICEQKEIHRRIRNRRRRGEIPAGCNSAFDIGDHYAYTPESESDYASEAEE